MTNKGEAEAQIICYGAEGELWTETDGEVIYSMRDCHTSMKEIPTLQTSAWIPYCSPDILSGCGAKRKTVRAKLEALIPLHTHIFISATLK